METWLLSPVQCPSSSACVSICEPPVSIACNTASRIAFTSKAALLELSILGATASAPPLSNGTFDWAEDPAENTGCGPIAGAKTGAPPNAPTICCLLKLTGELDVVAIPEGALDVVAGSGPADKSSRPLRALSASNGDGFDEGCPNGEPAPPPIGGTPGGRGVKLGGGTGGRPRGAAVEGRAAGLAGRAADAGLAVLCSVRLTVLNNCSSGSSRCA